MIKETPPNFARILPVVVAARLRVPLRCTVESHAVELAIIPAVSHRGVEVDCTATPKLVSGVKGHEPLPLVGHVVRQISPMKQNTEAERLVVLAFIVVNKKPSVEKERA